MLMSGIVHQDAYFEINAVHNEKIKSIDVKKEGLIGNGSDMTDSI